MGFESTFGWKLLYCKEREELIIDAHRYTADAGTLAGRQQGIHSERDPKLAAARQHRQVRRQQGA